VSPRWNAAAISGEYLSAAQLPRRGRPGAPNGVDVLWYPVGFAAGYLALLLFVAAPLRRSGAFTLPDFCEVRLGSLAAAQARHRVSCCSSAGCTWCRSCRAPASRCRRSPARRTGVGVLLVGGVVTATWRSAACARSRSSRRFQYWLKLTALGAAGDVPVRAVALATASRSSRARPTSDWLPAGQRPTCSARTR
jgi:hypothetical protein